MAKSATARKRAAFGKKSKLQKVTPHSTFAIMTNVTATRAKNEFGSILEQAIHLGPVAITRHQVPKAVLIPFAEYELLRQARSSMLDDLETEFDGLLASMQTTKSKRATETAFAASPAKLGRAAVKQAVKKR